MREIKKKKLSARRYADLSLQFYRDKEGTPNFLITSNEQEEGKTFCTGVDSYIFARNLVNSNLICLSDLAFLCDFFDRARKEALMKLDKQDVENRLNRIDNNLQIIKDKVSK